MEVDKEPVPQQSLNDGLDSDDETLRFEQEDDLYAADLDDADAKWVLKQHRPVAECEHEDGDNSNGNGEGKVDDDNDDDDDTADETADDQPPTISGSKDKIGNPGVRPPAGGQQQEGGTADKKGGVRLEGLATDAQLSCPLCFTTVCLECQRHAKYLNQFRAVTGINVNVKLEEFLTLDQVSGGSGGGGGRRKGGRKNREKSATARHNSRSSDRRGVGRQPPEGGVGGGGERAVGEEEMFHPVCCGECDHIVGVYDADEVFHFFGVIASG
ncbi:unnamed protein product [Hapterophycus canaliculatus]